MSRIDDIVVKQKSLVDEQEMAEQEECNTILRNIEERIKRFGFETTDFKGVHGCFLSGIWGA